MRGGVTAAAVAVAIVPAAAAVTVVPAAAVVAVVAAAALVAVVAAAAVVAVVAVVGGSGGDSRETAVLVTAVGVEMKRTEIGYMLVKIFIFILALKTLSMFSSIGISPTVTRGKTYPLHIFVILVMHHQISHKYREIKCIAP